MSEAFQKRSATEAQIKTIQNDKDLTDEAKAKRIAPLRATLNSYLAQERGSAAASRDEQHTKTLRKLFGLSVRQSASETEKIAVMQSHRDALFRADGLTKPEDAHRLLERARLVGDELLARGIALVSYERSWAEVLEAYASASTDTAGQLSELRMLEDRSMSRQRQMNEAVQYSPIGETAEERAIRMRA